MADDEALTRAVIQGARRAGGAAAPRRVHVSLFGGLGIYCRERPLVVDVPAEATVADVIDVLGRRLGSAFLDSVMESSGERNRCCRIFVNGSRVELEARLPAGGSTPEIELIVLTAFEGG